MLIITLYHITHLIEPLMVILFMQVPSDFDKNVHLLKSIFDYSIHDNREAVFKEDNYPSRSSITF